MARTADEWRFAAAACAERKPHHTSWSEAREEYLADHLATAESRLAEVERQLAAVLSLGEEHLQAIEKVQRERDALRAELATLRDSDDHHRLACEHYASELGTMRGRLEKSEAKLQRVRDWLKYEANSECGIANEIDGVLRAARGES